MRSKEAPFFLGSILAILPLSRPPSYPISLCTRTRTRTLRVLNPNKLLDFHSMWTPWAMSNIERMVGAIGATAKDPEAARDVGRRALRLALAGDKGSLEVPLVTRCVILFFSLFPTHHPYKFSNAGRTSSSGATSGSCTPTPPPILTRDVATLLDHRFHVQKLTNAFVVPRYSQVIH